MLKKMYRKINNPFFLPIITIFILIMVMNCASVFASSITNESLYKSYCKKNYPKCSVKVVSKYNPKIMEHRKDKKVVYVEKFISYSKGKYGYSKKGEYVKYNKKVKKGKKVVSYFVYNPYTNYCDDVVAVIDNKMIR